MMKTHSTTQEPVYFTRQSTGHVALDLESIHSVLKSNNGELVVQFTNSGRWQLSGSVVSVGDDAGSLEAQTLNLRFSLPNAESKQDPAPKLNRSGNLGGSQQLGVDVHAYDQLLENLRLKNEADDLTSRSRERLLAVVLIVVYYVFGVVYYTQAESWSFINAIYFVTVTLTTVGYGDLLPTTDTSKLVTCGFVFFGIALAGTAFGMISAHVIEALEDLDGTEAEDDAVEHPWKALMWALMYSVVGVFSGALYYSLSSAEDLSFLNAFYMSVITCTTVGYGDFSPQSEAGRMIGVFWILAGVACTAHSISRIAYVYTGTMMEKMRRRKMNRQITLSDLQEFGGDDNALNQNEFTLCKLKATGKITTGDVEECHKMFAKLDYDGGGLVDLQDLIQDLKAHMHDQAAA